MNKNEVFQQEIEPLVWTIHMLCKRHGIPMLVVFATPTETDPTEAFLSAVLNREVDPPAKFLVAMQALVDDVIEIRPWPWNMYDD